MRGSPKERNPLTRGLGFHEMPTPHGARACRFLGLTNNRKPESRHTDRHFFELVTWFKVFMPLPSQNLRRKSQIIHVPLGKNTFDWFMSGSQPEMIFSQPSFAFNFEPPAIFRKAPVLEEPTSCGTPCRFICGCSNPICTGRNLGPGKVENALIELRVPCAKLNAGVSLFEGTL